MGAYEDFVAFVDSGSGVPYYVTNAKYVYKPNIFSFTFTYDFKIYYKSYNNYYVGVPFSDFVRSINAQDFNVMKELYELRENESVKVKTQLVFDL